MHQVHVLALFALASNVVKLNGSNNLVRCLAFFLKNDLTNRESQVMPSLFNREGMAMPSLSNREGMAMPSLLLCFTPNTQGRHMKSFDLLLFTRNEI